MKSAKESKSNHLNRPPTSRTWTSIQPLQKEDSRVVDGAILRVPLDLLHEIILYCLPIYPTIHSASPVISSLSRVSSTWRAAVLSSPRLWARLFVTVDDEDNLGHCAQMVTQWFERARSVPLSFFLNIDFEAFDEDIPRIRSFLVGLSSIMLRVRHFGLHARLTRDLLSAFVDLQWELPHLKKLDLFSHPGVDQFRRVAFSVPLFQTAPNLIHIAIQNVIFCGPDIHIVPWSQLTNINLVSSISVSRWIEFLNMCPKLRTFNVFIRDDASPSSLPYSSDVHHSLERLYVDIRGPPFLKLLSIYNFPSLQALRVVYLSELRGFLPPRGISALANLREFSFSAMGLKIPREHFTYMAEILCEMVNLEELEFQRPSEDFIPLYEALSFKEPEKALLPRLTTFKIWIAEELDGQPFFEMVSSRCNTDTIPAGYVPLREFGVGVGSEYLFQKTRERYGPWIGGLPPQLRVSIEMSGLNRPERWTFPVSEPM